MFATEFFKIPRELLKRALFVFYHFIPSTLLSSEKYFDRNQLPQLSQKILMIVNFHTKEVVNADTLLRFKHKEESI